MSARLLCPALLALFTHAAIAQTGDFHRQLSIPNQADIYVSTGSGNIRITPAADREVSITGHVHGGWGHGEDVAGRVRRIIDNPPIEQSGTTLRIGDSPDKGLLNNISIDYDIRVPRDAALNLRSGSGDLDVDGVGRFLAANSGSGSVRAHGVHGPAQLQTGSGDITLDETGSGQVHARTGSGSVRLRGLDGSLEAHSGSGDVEAAGRLQGPGELSSDSGSIRLHVAIGSRFDVSASTGSGSVRTHLPGLQSTDEDHHRIAGSVNGGGAPLRIHTGSGDIDISAE